MRSIVLVAACLACVGHARTVQPLKNQQQVKHDAAQLQERDLKTLVTLVLAFSPSSAYTVAPTQARYDQVENRRAYGGGYRNIPAYGGGYRNSLYDNYDSPSHHRNSNWGIPDSPSRNGYDYSSPYRRGYSGHYDNYDSPSQYRNRRWGSYDSPSRSGYDYSSSYRRGYGGQYGNGLYDDYNSPSQYRNRRWGSYDSPSRSGYDYSSPYRRGYGGHYRDSNYDRYDYSTPHRRGYGAGYGNRFGNGYGGYGGHYRSRDNFWESEDSAQIENRWGSGSVTQTGGNFLDMPSTHHQYVPHAHGGGRSHAYGGGRYPRGHYDEGSLYDTPESADNAWKW